jgi:uncharacterized membrane protein YheB (UPF0754 family)
MMDFSLLLFPVSGTLIGWLTGLILSGIIVDIFVNQKRVRLSEQLSSYVAAKFISPELVREKVAQPTHFLKLMPLIEHHIDDFLRNRLKTAIPMIGMLIGDRTISQLKAVFMQELEVIFPEVLNKYVSDLAGSFDFKKEIEKRLLAVPPADIETLLKPPARKLFRIVGIISGLVTGLVSILIHFFIV